MKSWMAVLVLALPLTMAHAKNDGGDKGGRGHSSPRTGGNPGVAAPEIDGTSGALAIALAGGGLALLSRARRLRPETN